MKPVDLFPILRKAFESCDALDGARLFRCERRSKGVVRGIYFFRQVTEVPSVSELAEFQKEVVAPSYFATASASRWSHYVVYVLDRKFSDADLAGKFAIEADTDYARKVVIAAADLDDFLNWDVAAHVEAEKPNALQQEWMRTLSAAGISSVASDLSRASVVRSIKAGSAQVEPVQVSRNSVERNESSLFIRKLEIARFGDRALRGDFNLGTVTLVRGANGAGKTSLLEAIEHFLCGATRRSGGKSESLRATVSFSDGKKANSGVRQHSDYQERDLRWYGRTTNRGNKLFEGFARYNFLNADAAVELVRDEGLRDLKAALSKVALGPDASHTWNRIQEFLGDVSREISPLNNQIGVLESKRSQAFRRLETLRVASPQVSSRVSLLTNRLREIGWPVEGWDNGQLVDFQPYALLRASLDTVPERCRESVDGVFSEIAYCQDELAVVSAWEKELDEVRAERSVIESQRGDLDVEGRKLARLEKYRAVGFERLAVDAKAIADRKAEIASAPTTPVDEQLFDVLSKLHGDVRFGRLVERLRADAAQASERVAGLSARKSDAEAALREREGLMDQLKVFARQHVLLNPNDDACPVCETRVGNAELLSRLDQAKPSAVATLLSSVSEELRSAEIAKKNTDVALALAMRVIAVDTNFEVLSVAEVFEVLAQRNRELAELDARWSEVSRELSNLSREGYSQLELEALVAWLRAGRSDASLREIVPDELQSKRAALEARRLRMLSDATQLDEREAEVKANLGARVIAFEAGDITFVRSAVRARLEALTAFVERFRALPEGTQSLYRSDLAGFAEICNRLLAEMESIGEQMQAERSRVGELQLLQEQIVRDDGSIANLKRERDNLKASLSALTDISERHSLDQGLAAFLQHNLGSIQSIFSRIHSPNELTLSALADCQLMRVGSNRLADLSQISTGQRSALMLSIFLTLNLSLRSGPPMMLIDDPVAHVDDLNSLAFLDFLADVAEGGRRQIVLATADDRLANLFEKKMAFLGEELSVIELSRASLRA